MIGKRDLYKANSHIEEYSKRILHSSKVLYHNYGFISIPESGGHIIKFYEVDDNLDIRMNEYSTAQLFRDKNILVPSMDLLEGKIDLGGKIFEGIQMENIRGNGFRKVLSFEEIEPYELGTFLRKIHSIRQNHIHGNFHPSNIFIKEGSKCELGIFDFIPYGLGKPEQDLARIYIHSGFNEIYLNQVIAYYDYEISNILVKYFALKELIDGKKNGYMTGYDQQILRISKELKYFIGKE